MTFFFKLKKYLHESNTCWAIKLQDGKTHHSFTEYFQTSIENAEEKFVKDTVKLYDASTSPVFWVVIVATPNCVSASNVGMMTLMIFPGLLQADKTWNLTILNNDIH